MSSRNYFLFYFMLLLIASNLIIAGSSEVQDRGLDFTLTVCSAVDDCRIEPAKLTLDYTYSCDDPYTCYTVPPQSVYEDRWGIFANGDSVTFNRRFGSNRLFVNTVSGDQYRMFYFLNNELTFDVDLSAVGCGMNAALNLNSMPEDGGKASLGYTGAAYGTGFCDGQDLPPNCHEMDVWESNSLASMFTIHPCNETNCNAYGCGLNPYPFGQKSFYGRGPAYRVDTLRPFTVVTRFVTTDETNDGDLKEIQQFYIQDGKRIEIPLVEGGFNSVSDEFCEYHYVPTLEGYDYEFFGVKKGMTKGMKQGMVLILSLWGDADDTFMQWLDAEPYGPCPDFADPDAVVTYSNIRFGPIGTTV